jgi:hypothetical protein
MPHVVITVVLTGLAGWFAFRRLSRLLPREGLARSMVPLFSGVFAALMGYSTWVLTSPLPFSQAPAHWNLIPLFAFAAYALFELFTRRKNPWNERRRQLLSKAPPTHDIPACIAWLQASADVDADEATSIAEEATRNGRKRRRTMKLLRSQLKHLELARELLVADDAHCSDQEQETIAKRLSQLKDDLRYMELH